VKFIKHKNMRDVCAQVIEEQASGDVLNFKVCWINRLGTYDNPEPFPMGTARGLAIEEISITREEFAADWEEMKRADLHV
jgi:hypothetical protein